MERIVSKTNDTLRFAITEGHGPLADGELDVVTGGSEYIAARGIEPIDTRQTDDGHHEMSDLSAVGEPAHRWRRQRRASVAAPAIGWSALAWMEKIMSKTNATSSLDDGTKHQRHQLQDDDLAR
jgi:hypothetical protein